MIDSFKIDHIPDGWREIKSANTAPDGWVWFCNGKSRFANEWRDYRHALVPERLAQKR